MANLSRKDLALLARAVEWQYRLNEYTDAQLKEILGIVEAARKDIEKQLTGAKVTKWSRQRSEELLEELNDLLLGVSEKVGKKISATTTTAGVHAHTAHSDILSFSGKAANVVAVTATPAQLMAIVNDVPVGGRTLQEWVDRTFTQNLKDKIKHEIATGMLQGETYRKLAARISEGWTGTRRELETITKTYVQSINVQAMNEVYKANPDIVKKVKWHATMEPRSKNGRGTCVRCSALDGTVYPIGEDPGCPLHPLCRCVLIPITASAEAMGLSQKDINDAARPYNIAEDKVIGLGGSRGAKAAGTTHINKYADWFETLSPTAQKNSLGPARYKLWSEGKVRFQDLVDLKTGRQKTLAELGYSFAGQKLN